MNLVEPGGEQPPLVAQASRLYHQVVELLSVNG